MATVEVNLKSTLLAVILLMFAVRATSAGLPDVAYLGDEPQNAAAEPIGMASECDGYQHAVARKLIPCRSLRFFVFRRAPPPPEKGRRVAQYGKAPPPQNT